MEFELLNPINNKAFFNEKKFTLDNFDSIFYLIVFCPASIQVDGRIKNYRKFMVHTKKYKGIFQPHLLVFWQMNTIVL